MPSDFLRHSRISVRKRGRRLDAFAHIADRIAVAGDGMSVAEVSLPRGNSIVLVRKPSRAARASVHVIGF